MPLEHARPEKERQLRFFEAINEACAVCMERDSSVYIIGLGAPDHTGVFGTTVGLVDRFGPNRVFDSPCSENAITGVALGSAIKGMRPIMTHIRVDFALLSLEQIVNQAAKWYFMYGGQISAPMVIRMVIGRGWGQGPQHSQSLQTFFAHIPGLKVIMPTTPYDAKGMMISSIEDNNPVISLEHRWLYNISGNVPEGHYTVALGKTRTVQEGRDVTIVSTSHMTLEAIHAARILSEAGLSAEVIDVRTLSPFDETDIVQSVNKTGYLITADTATRSLGFGSEIVARVTEKAWTALKAAPVRISLPDCPMPTARVLSHRFYPRATDIVSAAWKLLGRKGPPPIMEVADEVLSDVPDPSFNGPLLNSAFGFASRPISGASAPQGVR